MPNKVGRPPGLLIFLLIVAATIAPLPKQSYGQSDQVSLAKSATLQDIQRLFSAGHFERASRRVNEVLVLEKDFTARERAQLYLMKARLEMAFGRQGELKLWLSKAYEVDPDLTLDPVLDPPPLHATWEDVKRRTDPSATSKQNRQLFRGSEGAKESTPSMAASVEVDHRASFWPGLLPLGVGHFDAGRYKEGALFLSAELLFIVLAQTLPAQDTANHDAPKATEGPQQPRVQPYATEILSTLSLMGAYGYELVNMLPDLMHRDQHASESLRGILGVFPFGVPQAKNGANMKAFGIASVQATFLMAGLLAPRSKQRHLALGTFALAWAYSIFDGMTGRQITSHTTNLGLGVIPVVSKLGQLGAAFSVTLQR